MNTIADITKVIKDGQIYVKRSDVIKYVGDSILKKNWKKRALCLTARNASNTVSRCTMWRSA